MLYGDRVVVSGLEFRKNWIIQICENNLKLLRSSVVFYIYTQRNIYLPFFYDLVRYDLVMPDDNKMCQKLITLK